MAELEARDVKKRFGARTALQGVSIAIGAGEVCALFGPNGAGKTTLLKILAGLSRPTDGKVSVLGGDPREASIRGAIGVLGHGGWLHDALTARENLEYYAALYRLRDAPARIAAVLEEVGLADRAADRVSGFSRGMRQRLSIARSVLHDPRVLLLDEPFTGLDRAAARALGEFLHRIATRGRTVFAVTHEIDVSLELATRVAILSAGRLVLDRARAGLDRGAFERLYLDAVEPPKAAATA